MVFELIRDSSLDEVLEQEFDLAIFGCGYEERCTAVYQRLPSKLFRKALVLSFDSYSENAVRKKNEAFFEASVGGGTFKVPSDKTEVIYYYLHEFVAGMSGGRDLNILIDYSSMTRLWYAAIFNFFRSLKDVRKVRFSLVYCAGIYQGDIQSRDVRDVISIPGCEGYSDNRKMVAAVFGLGFEKWTPYSVYERLEPDCCYAYYAESDNPDIHASNAKEINKDFLDEQGIEVVALPLKSVETAYRKLVDIASFLGTSANVNLIPLGPKPHIMTSLFVSMNFRDVTCFYVRGTPRDPLPVLPSGDFVVTEVEMVPDWLGILRA